ncbi:Glycosyltransferase involved in cell wall bisynthesis [Polaribacter sp. Hel1_33_78]|uniref:glycosyltransferase family 1 protein n=1 Tax=Polaribacter sp. Hel1_33_78 TaxID=1336804 RepID=UPI00087D0EAD|nr:glycosyltransferase family 1 protein [Polaribacter sp. Hel1_33_78]SDT95221.1 Glycosyltransferase involved in cell wall bisynthesis [Polaribacter sp. Hel1_33_78]
MFKVFIFPNSVRKNQSNNPYLQEFAFVLDKQVNVTNYYKFNVNNDIVSLFINLFTDYHIINWPENIPNHRFGLVQYYLFKLVFNIRLFLGKKNIFILHNKTAHNIKTKKSFEALAFCIKKAHLIFTHSLEGVDFVKKNFNRTDVKYFPHPTYSNLDYKAQDIKYDIIIWGTIHLYKNVDGFIKYFNNEEFFKRYRLLVCGYCQNKELENSIFSEVIKNENITFINKRLCDEDIVNNINQSRFILFTYTEDSVLSSGSLIFSLPSEKQIIGPNVGSFKELSNNKIVSCYNSFEDIPKLIDKLKSNNKSNNLVSNYVSKYTWSNFGSFVIESFIK